MKFLFDAIKKNQLKVKQNQLSIFIFSALMVALILIGVSLWMYEEFGTAQLDLSRPSLQEAREQAKKDAEREKRERSEAENFDSNGKIDSKFLDKFGKLYDRSLNRLKDNFFGENALNDETLNITNDTQGEN
jgi:hypothetical protein